MRGKKKFIYLFMTVFVLCMGISVVSFASTTNRTSNVVTGDEGTVLADGTNGTLEAPTLRMYEKDLNNLTTSHQAFQLDLTNAKWSGIFDDSGNLVDGFITGMDNIKVTQLSDSSIIIEGDVNGTTNSDGDVEITVKMLTELTDEGDAIVTVDPLDSVISSGSYKFATVAKGSTTTTISGIVEIPEEGGKINNIVIKETAPMTIKSGNIVLELSKGWEFSKKPEIRGIYPSNLDSFFTVQEPEGGLCIITVADDFKGSDSAMTISISASVKYNENAAGFNNICEMTVSGAGTTRTTIEVAKAPTKSTSGGSSGSGSSGGGGSSSYNRTSSITKSSAITNGSVYCNLSSAKRGNEVEFFVFPDEGYRIVDVRVKDGNGNSLDITKKANGVYSFTMPSTGVDIEADFELIPSIVISNNQVPFNNTSDYPERRFSDVYQNDWYYDNIMWAVENGIAQGYDDGTFRPNEQITRAEMVIMLKNLYDSMYE